MKRLFTALLCFFAVCSFAQNDSVSLGAGANNMVFYSLSTHDKTSAANDDWHIAFSIRHVQPPNDTRLGVAVRINEAYGLQLYRSTQKLAQFSSFDTTGWQSWTREHNPDTTWDVGAFNANINFSDAFNYGWGEYNSGNHNVYGDSTIYLIVLPDGSFKKFAILNLLYDTAYNIQYANLDNSGLTNTEIRKAPYLGKSFVYLNLETAALTDKEPMLTDWDFVALRYNDSVYNPSNPTQDIGILTNDANSTYAASDSPALQPCYYGTDYSNYINTIGKTWMGVPSDTVIPGLAYFVKTSVNTYKITITGFGGATTGVIDFSVGTCANTSGISEINANTNLNVYPVPASDIINVQVNTAEGSSTDIQLLDISGRVISTEQVLTHSGENSYTINTSPIQNGNYILSVSSAEGKVNRMISIVK